MLSLLEFLAISSLITSLSVPGLQHSHDWLGPPEWQTGCTKSLVEGSFTTVLCRRDLLPKSGVCSRTAKNWSDRDASCDSP